MAKGQLNFDVGQLRNRISFYQEQNIPDGAGGSLGSEWVLVANERSKRMIKNRTSHAQTQGGSFDFYQVWEFVLRKNPNYTVEKDMRLDCEGESFTIRGISPLETNPKYIIITTEKIWQQIY